jgi:hypothetical protein
VFLGYKLTLNRAFWRAMALLAFLHRAMQVAQHLAAHGHANISLHEDVNIEVRKERQLSRHFSLFRKT